MRVRTLVLLKNEEEKTEKFENEIEKLKSQIHELKSEATANQSKFVIAEKKITQIGSKIWKRFILKILVDEHKEELEKNEEENKDKG